MEQAGVLREKNSEWIELYSETFVMNSVTFQKNISLELAHLYHLKK